MSIYPEKWTVEHPDRLQLYSVATPNGKKVSIFLEEAGVPYEPHLVHIGKGDQHDPGFLKVNPNGKIPAIIDPDGPNGEPLVVIESGAILLYLAEKTGKFLPTDVAGRSETLQWLFFQMANVGPFFGQFGHFFMFAKGKTDSYGEERYTKEARRLLEVLEGRLAGREYLAADQYTIADMATVPWVLGLEFYGGLEVLRYAELEHVPAWVERCTSRPATVRGMEVNAFPAS